MTTTTPTTTTVQTELAARIAVLAKIAREQAEQAWRTAEDQAIDALLTAGIASITLDDGTKVTLKGGLDGEVNRKISVDVLREHLTGATFDAVTKRTVDTKAFDAAVTSGLIPATVAAEATKTSPKKATLLITAAVA